MFGKGADIGNGKKRARKGSYRINQRVTIPKITNDKSSFKWVLEKYQYKPF
jgi:hypothetical protein